MLGIAIALPSLRANNILQGCLYYTGANFKGTLMGRINNEKQSSLSGIQIDSFPQNKKSIVP